MRKYLAFGVVSLLSVLVVLTGCTPVATAPPAPPPTPVASPSPSPKPSPIPTPVVAPADKAQYGGTIKYFVRRAAAGFDLHLMPSFAPFYAGPVFNNLVYFNPNFKSGGPDNIIGDLAERWEVSKDEKTITFYLQKNVKWHDGQPFTADDVVYSMEKMVDPKRSSISGNFPAFAAIRKIDNSTVAIDLKNPSPSFLVQLAGGYAAIQAKHKSSADQRKPEQFMMGTGPFKFKSYDGVTGGELVRNPDYFKKDKNGMQLPYLDGISMRIIADQSAQVDAFVAKRLDLSSPSIAVSTKEAADRLVSQAKDAVTEYTSSTSGMIFWLNLDNPALKDVRVRRAMGLLMEQDKLIVGAYGGIEFGAEGAAFLPPAWSLAKSERLKLMGWDKPFEQRVAEAKKLMADAGYASGFKLKIVISNLPEWRRTAATLSDTYRRYLNIESEVVEKDVNEARKMRDARDYGLYMEMILALLGDPDEYMAYFKTGGASNWTGYSNAKLDQLWQDESRAMDISKRKQIVQDIERTLLTDLPALPTGMLGTYAISWYPYVKNFVIGSNSYASHIRMEQVWMKQ